MHILGVKVDNLTKKEVLFKIDRFLTSSGQYYITTPNPEIVLKAQKDDDFQDILNYADLAIADGFGLVLASILFFGWKKRIKQRIRGVDLVQWLCASKQNSGEKLFLLGGKDAVAKLAADKLKYKYSNFKIVGYESGPKINREGKPANKDEELINNKIIKKINETGPQILLVAFGAPKQEKWIYNYLDQIPSVKVAIGVGGTFDFISGKIKRAPKALQNLGLEWLWRLIQEPKRLKRIFNATFVFLGKSLSWKFRRKFFYRPNVCAFIYKQHKIFLAERIDDPGHWQMPQGGVRKGEKRETAIIRELKEELGTDKFEIKKIIPNVHQYCWSKELMANRKSFYPYKGQKQTLCILEFLGNDGDINLERKEFINFQWVDKNNFIKTLHPYRRTIGQKALIELDKLERLE